MLDSTIRFAATLVGSHYSNMLTQDAQKDTISRVLLSALHASSINFNEYILYAQFISIW